MTKRKMKNFGPTSPAKTAEFILRIADDRQVCIGPAVSRPTDGTSSRYWYVIVCTSHNGQPYVTKVDLPCDDHDGALIEQAHLMFEIGAAATKANNPVVIHTFDTELDMAVWCEKLWPCPRMTKLRETVEAEQTTTHGAG